MGLPISLETAHGSAEDVRAGYRFELQGLRAFAVLLVAVYHIWPEALPGGFVGVDVFFVISGFLITGLLLKEVERTDRLDLLRFWARRIRRLLPAACFVLLATLAGTVMLLPQTRWMDTAQEILSSALYVQNWNLAAQSVDYTARAAAISPVQHYWSLSIEEQFYLGWPILLLGLSRIVRPARTRSLFSVIALLAIVASLTWSIAASFSATSSYFVTTTRIWELALGGFVAAVEPKLILPHWYRVILSWAGIAAVLVAGLLLPTSLAFPGWVALLPTLGTVLVIVARNAGDWSLAPILSWAPVRYLGDISYSVYLWHWPVIVLLPLVPGAERFSLNQKGMFLAVSLILAGLTKIAIEDPFRSGWFARLSAYRWPSYATGAVMMVTVCSLAGGLMCQQKRVIETKARVELGEYHTSDAEYPGAAAMDPVGERPPEAAANPDRSSDRTPGPKPVQKFDRLTVKPDPLVARYDVPRVYNDGCDLRQTSRASICEYGDPAGKIKIALIGDSHAAQYLPALESLAAHYHWRILVLEKSACLFSTVPVRVRHNGAVKLDCEQWKKQAMDLLLSASPDLVITSSAMPVIYNEYYQLPPTSELVVGYRNLWRRLTDRGIPVIVIRDNPRPLLDVPTCAWQNRLNPSACAQKRASVLDRHDDPLSAAVSGGERLQSLDLSPLYCAGDSCPVVIGNVLVYRDGDHLTATFARTLAPAIGHRLREVLPVAD